MATGESLAYLMAPWLSFQVSLQVGPLSSIFCWDHRFKALCPNLNQMARYLGRQTRQTHSRLPLGAGKVSSGSYLDWREGCGGRLRRSWWTRDL